MMSIKKHFFRLLGIPLILIAISFVDLEEVRRIFLEINYVYLVTFIPCLILLILIKSLRWKEILKAQDIYLSLKKTFFIYMSSLFIGALTPGRIGEFAKVFYLKNEGYSLAKSSFSVIVDRLLDLLFLLLIASVNIGILFLVIKKGFGVYVFLVFSLIVLSYILYRQKKIYKNILRYILGILFSLDYAKKIEFVLNNLFSDIRKFKGRSILMIVLLTVISWIIYYYQLYLLGLAVKIEMSFLSFVICVSIAAVVNLVPVSIAGIGTRDSVLVFLFPYMGSTTGSAIVFSSMFLYMYLVSIIIGFLAWIKEPIKL